MEVSLALLPRTPTTTPLAPSRTCQPAEPPAFTDPILLTAHYTTASTYNDCTLICPTTTHTMTFGSREDRARQHAGRHRQLRHSSNSSYGSAYSNQNGANFSEHMQGQGKPPHGFVASFSQYAPNRPPVQPTYGQPSLVPQQIALPGYLPSQPYQQGYQTVYSTPCVYGTNRAVSAQVYSSPHLVQQQHQQQFPGNQYFQGFIQGPCGNMGPALHLPAQIPTPAQSASTSAAYGYPNQALSANSVPQPVQTQYHPSTPMRSAPQALRTCSTPNFPSPQMARTRGLDDRATLPSQLRSRKSNAQGGQATTTNGQALSGATHAFGTSLHSLAKR